MRECRIFLFTPSLCEDKCAHKLHTQALLRSSNVRRDNRGRKNNNGRDEELYFLHHLAFLFFCFFFFLFLFFLILPSLFDMICCNVRAFSPTLDDRRLPFRRFQGREENTERWERLHGVGMGSLMDQKDGDDDHHDSTSKDDENKWKKGREREDFFNPLSLSLSFHPWGMKLRKMEGTWSERQLS